MKNIQFINPENAESSFEKTSVKFLKEKEIIELIKYQNIIDVGTPSFLNINFVLKKETLTESAKNIK